MLTAFPDRRAEKSTAPAGTISTVVYQPDATRVGGAVELSLSARDYAIVLADLKGP
jgi:hypothetical protein